MISLLPSYAVPRAHALKRHRLNNPVRLLKDIPVRGDIPRVLHKEEYGVAEDIKSVDVKLQRRLLLSLLSFGWAITPGESLAAGVSCPTLRGYALQKCLREVRQKREAQEAAANPDGSVQEATLKNSKYEQPGELVTLPSGVQYREVQTGSGRVAAFGSICEITYTVFRLSSGGYYKYSSGGTPMYMWSLGHGNEGKDDLGQVYRFRLGDSLSLPAAATPAVEGMREGGTRRVLVPPQYGWLNDQVGPPPDTFGAQRRLASHREEPLLLEVELVRAYSPEAGAAGTTGQDQVDTPGSTPRAGVPFQLPAPPSPYKDLLAKR